jgi:type IV secretory pathway VirJ component
MRRRLAQPSAPAIGVTLALLGALALLAAPARAAPPAAAPRAGAAAHPRADGADAHLPAGRFGTVAVYIPDGKPQSVAIFLSGDGGWELGVLGMARALRTLGAVVIGVDIRRYLASLGAAARPAGASCRMIGADFEALSHRVQKEIGMSEYHVPVLVGYSSGATVVYAALVQAPPGTFAGALSLGFCADQDFGGAALCPGAGLHYAPNRRHELVLEPATTLRQPWIALQGDEDQVCSARAASEFAAAVTGGQLVSLPRVGHGFGVERNWMPQFRDAYERLSARVETPPGRAAGIADLPVQEVPAAGGSAEFALLLTGDGGWAGLDQDLAARLAASGVPTVALNSLQYFWTARTPEETARDVARILRYYFAAWNKQRVLLVGYSFGADVLPFVFNRLPADLRARVASVSLLGIDAHADFEVRIADWVGSGDRGPPTLPELAAVRGVPVLCIYGAGESDSICPGLPPGGGVARAEVGRGHHFSGEYATLADRILAFAQSGRPVT